MVTRYALPSWSLDQEGLAGLRAELSTLSVTSMPGPRNRWKAEGDGDSRGFNPHGYFVYCLWGDDPGCPIYVGQSTNVLGRLGSHVNTKGQQVRYVTLLRCKSQTQMDETEDRMIAHYQPPLNIRGIRLEAAAG